MKRRTASTATDASDERACPENTNGRASKPCASCTRSAARPFERGGSICSPCRSSIPGSVPGSVRGSLRRPVCRPLHRALRRPLRRCFDAEALRWCASRARPGAHAASPNRHAGRFGALRSAPRYFLCRWRFRSLRCLCLRIFFRRFLITLPTWAPFVESSTRRPIQGSTDWKSSFRLCSVVPSFRRVARRPCSLASRDDRARAPTSGHTAPCPTVLGRVAHALDLVETDASRESCRLRTGGRPAVEKLASAAV